MDSSWLPSSNWLLMLHQHLSSQAICMNFWRIRMAKFWKGATMCSRASAKKQRPTIRQSWKANITICSQTRLNKIKRKRFLEKLSRETASPKISSIPFMAKGLLSMSLASRLNSRGQRLLKDHSTKNKPNARKWISQHKSISHLVFSLNLDKLPNPKSLKSFSRRMFLPIEFHQ